MRTPIRSAVTVDDHRLMARHARGCVILVDDDAEILAALKALLEMEGYACEAHATAAACLQQLGSGAPRFPGPRCVLCDMKMPGMDGLEFQRRLAELNPIPLIFMSGGSATQDAVHAFRGGAVDFMIKPVDATALLLVVAKALKADGDRRQNFERLGKVTARVATLTDREREVARRVAQGQTNLSIAADLGLALRTVKLHRQRAMEKIGVSGVTDLVRVADEAGL